MHVLMGLNPGLVNAWGYSWMGDYVSITGDLCADLLSNIAAEINITSGNEKAGDCGKLFVYPIHNLTKTSHTIPEVMNMAKQGMNRPDWTHTQPKNTAAAVPEIQGKAKHGKAHANPIIAGTRLHACSGGTEPRLLLGAGASSQG